MTYSIPRYLGSRGLAGFLPDIRSRAEIRTAKAELVHQRCRVDWVLSEISKIEAEQKTAGKTGGSSLGGRRRSKSTDDAEEVDGVLPWVAKRRRTDKTEKVVAGWNDHSRTTRSKERMFSANEDVVEPDLKTGECGWHERRLTDHTKQESQALD